MQNDCWLRGPKVNEEYSLAAAYRRLLQNIRQWNAEKNWKGLQKLKCLEKVKMHL